MEMSPLIDPDKEIRNVARDEVQYRHARQSGGAHHETLDVHRLLIETVRDYAIFAMDPAGHILTWNAGAERLKGYTAEEAIGKHFSMFYTEPDLARRHPWHELEVAGRTGRFEDEGWRVKKDGSLFWANVVITRLRDSDGNLVGFAKITRDLTARREAELKAIADARRVADAEASNRAKSEFLAAMSHELRTPLNAIGGYVDLLAYGVHGQLTDPQAAALDRIQASQRHLLALISDLLNFSRIEAGRLTYDEKPVAIGQVMENVRVMAEPQALDRNISIDWIEPADPVVAIADEPKVQQVILNLVTNAIKYTEPGGHVDVRPGLRDGRVVIDVADNGIGIPEDLLEAVFEPFTQVGRSLTSTHEGTGLGLAISRELTRAMGGDLTVRSELDRGSTFTLSLPAAEAAEAAEAAG